MTLYDDRDVCVHAGFCGTTITNVWKMVRKTDDTTVRSMLVAMVERCPSGAISYSIDGEADNEPRLPSEIGVMVNGPLWVTGGIPVDVGERGHAADPEPSRVVPLRRVEPQATVRREPQRGRLPRRPSRYRTKFNERTRSTGGLA